MASLAATGAYLATRGTEPEVSGQAAAPRDALQNRTVEILERFGSWCEEHEADGYIGEFQVPNAHGRPHVDNASGEGTDQEEWLDLLDLWYARANELGLWATMWNASVLNFEPGSTIWLNAYTPPQDGSGSKTLSKSYPQAGVCEKPEHQSAGGVLRGVNVAGGEYEQPGFNNENPGIYDIHYRYPNAESYEFLANRGHRLVRLPFRWERVQPVPGGEFDEKEMERLRSSIAGAREARLSLILDCHNYARYATPSGDQVIGESAIGTHHFNDLWGRLSANFARDETVIGYGLMNEPHTMSGRDGLSPAEAWEDVSYKALEAIRATGDSKLVLVSGYDWSSARSWRDHHPAPWMEDSNVRYEAHQYFDLTNTGVYRVPYEAEVAAARSRGY